MNITDYLIQNGWILQTPETTRLSGKWGTYDYCIAEEYYLNAKVMSGSTIQLYISAEWECAYLGIFNIAKLEKQLSIFNEEVI
jgi:hypothetical protein